MIKSKAIFLRTDRSYAIRIYNQYPYNAHYYAYFIATKVSLGITWGINFES